MEYNVPHMAEVLKCGYIIMKVAVFPMVDSGNTLYVLCQSVVENSSFSFDCLTVQMYKVYTCYSNDVTASLMWTASLTTVQQC